MGIEDKFFTSKVPETLRCAICQDIANPPVSTSCGHVFCAPCLNQWFSGNTTCPVDRKELNGKIKKSPVLVRLLNELVVKCKNFELGCEWVGELANRSKHLESCDYQTIKCPMNRCDFHCLRADVQKHVQQCEWRLMTCKYCGKSIAAKYLNETFHYTVCENMVTSCKYCQKQLPRRDMKKHVSLECPMVTKMCCVPGCKKAFKRRDMDQHLRDNIVQHTKLICRRLKILEAENAELKRRISELEQPPCEEVSSSSSVEERDSEEEEEDSNDQ